jgi:type IV pilus assembly protein PilO
VTTTLKRPVAIGVLIAILLTLAWWQLLWKPQSSSLSAAQQQEQQATTQLLEAGQTLGHLKHLEKISPQLTSLERTLTAGVPAGTALDTFLLSLNAIAVTSWVQVSSVGPSQPVSAGDGLLKIPVGITVTGTYFEIQAFIRGLRGDSRLVVLDSLSETAGGSASGQVTATISCHILSGLPPTAAVSQLIGAS